MPVLQNHVMTSLRFIECCKVKGRSFSELWISVEDRSSLTTQTTSFSFKTRVWMLPVCLYKGCCSWCLWMLTTVLTDTPRADQCFYKQDLDLLFWLGSINTSRWFWHIQWCLSMTKQTVVFFPNSRWETLPAALQAVFNHNLYSKWWLVQTWCEAGNIHKHQLQF